MPSLRKWIDSQITPSNRKAEPVPIKVNDQVVVKRSVNRTFSRQNMKEVMVGTVTAFAQNGNAVVSLNRPGGRILRSEIPLKQLQPVADVYKRTAVQHNPAIRQIFTGR
jgi:hypothetical protein